MRRLLLTLALLAFVSDADAATSFRTGAGNKADASGTTISVQLTGIQAGDLIIGVAKNEGASTTITVSDGTSLFTMDPDGYLHDGSDLGAQMFYLLASVATGTVTYTATFGAAREFTQIAVAAFDLDSGATASFQDSASATGAGANLNSGNITVTGGDIVACGFWGNYATGTPTDNRALLGTAVGTGAVFGNSDGTQGWYRLMTSGATGAATHTNPPGNEWWAGAIGVGITAGGGGGGGAPKNLPLLGVGE